MGEEVKESRNKTVSQINSIRKTSGKGFYSYTDFLGGVQTDVTYLSELKMYILFVFPIQETYPSDTLTLM